MMDQNICFNGVLGKIIPELSLFYFLSGALQSNDSNEFSISFSSIICGEQLLHISHI